MDNSLREVLRRRLWPSDFESSVTEPAVKVWALLDGARDDRVFSLVRDSGLNYAPLYSGNLPIEIRRVAPYLVELDPEDPYTGRILELAWGNAWGIFMRVGANARLRHHLKGFLRVRDEQGRFMLFRYYDPRVLRQYLPTCRYDELKTVFGPIRQFIVEGEQPSQLLEFSLSGLQLNQRRHTLSVLAEEPGSSASSSAGAIR
jgi:hypothetical protein